MTSPYFAHSLQGRPEEEWEELEVHLQQVADLAALFASSFGASEWGWLAGLWHDLGKFRPEFQDRLRGSGESVEHAGVGAALAYSKDKACGLPLAFVIAGHHAGLADLNGSDGEPGGTRPLLERLSTNAAILASVANSLPAHLVSSALPLLPDQLSSGKKDLRAFELWVRFLFSCLVDADFLATESFYSPGLREQILAGYDEIPALRRRLDDFLDDLVFKSRDGSPVNRTRAEVLEACRKAASLPTGLFSLTVPTGGGKTLSAMSFALQHAELHGLKRIIVAIPFTSIIEQTARVYRERLGAGNVVEHHSGLDPIAAEKTDREAEIRRRLAAENWDAPVIVTTNVQLFESLFASSPSRCRKLHNIARSVILLDEPQSLPPNLLLPILEGMRELAGTYGCSVVLTTATQPALSRRESFPQGLDKVHEIIPDPPRLARDLDRIRTSWPDPDGAPTSYGELARELLRHERVLAIVHLRRDARTLAERLPEENRFHLSALMCAAHRAQVLNEAKEQLKKDLPCRLISTQLIEAGVDIDFPIVYRCLGGLDSLAQAAGRCNREGRLPGKGEVIYFLAETPPPAGAPCKGLQIVQGMLRSNGGRIDLLDTNVYEEYFRQLYFRSELDAKGIQALRQELRYSAVARAFRLIEESSQPVVVPYGDAERRLDDIRRHGVDRLRLRALQPFVVNIREQHVSILRNAGALEQVAEAVFALAPAFHHLYDERFGLCLDDDPQPDPALFVV